MQTATKFLLSALWVAFLGNADAQLQRLPLRREHATLSTSPKPSNFGEGQTIYYDSKRQVYIISYKGAEGESEQAFFELPTKAEAVVQGAAESISKGAPLLYRYTVHSLLTSREGISVFVITSQALTQEPAAPDKGWMIRSLPGATFPDDKGVRWSDVQKRPGNPIPRVPYATISRSGRETEEWCERFGIMESDWNPSGDIAGRVFIPQRWSARYCELLRSKLHLHHRDAR